METVNELNLNMLDDAEKIEITSYITEKGIPAILYMYKKNLYWMPPKNSSFKHPVLITSILPQKSENDALNLTLNLLDKRNNFHQTSLLNIKKSDYESKIKSLGTNTIFKEDLGKVQGETAKAPAKAPVQQPKTPPRPRPVMPEKIREAIQKGNFSKVEIDDSHKQNAFKSTKDAFDESMKLFDGIDVRVKTNKQSNPIIDDDSHKQNAFKSTKDAFDESMKLFDGIDVRVKTNKQSNPIIDDDSHKQNAFKSTKDAFDESMKLFDGIDVRIKTNKQSNPIIDDDLFEDPKSPTPPTTEPAQEEQPIFTNPNELTAEFVNNHQEEVETFTITRNFQEKDNANAKPNIKELKIIKYNGNYYGKLNDKVNKRITYQKITLFTVREYAPFDAKTNPITIHTIDNNNKKTEFEVPDCEVGSILQVYEDMAGIYDWYGERPNIYLGEDKQLEYEKLATRNAMAILGKSNAEIYKAIIKKENERKREEYKRKVGATPHTLQKLKRLTQTPPVSPDVSDTSDTDDTAEPFAETDNELSVEFIKAHKRELEVFEIGKTTEDGKSMSSKFFKYNNNFYAVGNFEGEDGELHLGAQKLVEFTPTRSDSTLLNCDLNFTTINNKNEKTELETLNIPARSVAEFYEALHEDGSVDTNRNTLDILQLVSAQDAKATEVSIAKKINNYEDGQGLKDFWMDSKTAEKSSTDFKITPPDKGKADREKSSSLPPQTKNTSSANGTAKPAGREIKLYKDVFKDPLEKTFIPALGVMLLLLVMIAPLAPWVAMIALIGSFILVGFPKDVLTRCEKIVGGLKKGFSKFFGGIAKIISKKRAKSKLEEANPKNKYESKLDKINAKKKKLEGKYKSFRQVKKEERLEKKQEKLEKKKADTIDKYYSNLGKAPKPTLKKRIAYRFGHHSEDINIGAFAHNASYNTALKGATYVDENGKPYKVELNAPKNRYDPSTLASYLNSSDASISKELAKAQKIAQAGKPKPKREGLNNPTVNK